MGEVFSIIGGNMRVLLRDAGTGSYFGREMAWVGHLEGAAEFGTLEAAGSKAMEWPGRDVLVVLRYEQPECELALSPVYCVKNAGTGGQRLRA